MQLIAHAVKNLAEAKRAVNFGCNLLEIDVSQNIFTGNFVIQHNALKGKFGIGKDPFELLSKIESEKLLIDLKAVKYSLNYKEKFNRLIKKLKIKGPNLTSIDLKIASKIAEQNNGKIYYGFLNKKSIDYFWKNSSLLYKPAGFSIHKDLIDQKLIYNLKSKYPHSKIWAWTVNDQNEIERLKKVGVGGVVTDLWRNES